MKGIPRLSIGAHLMVFFCLSFFFQVSIYAQGKAIGQVLLAIGKVKAIGADKVERELKRGDPLYTLDTIVTEVSSRSELKFTDGGIVNLIASTQYRVDSYVFNDPNQKSSTVATLIKGGFRAISGSVAKENPGGSTIRTAVATIGLRGTKVGAFYDTDKHLLAAGSDEGTVVVSNNKGSIPIGPTSPTLYATVLLGEAPRASREMPSALAAVMPSPAASARPTPPSSSGGPSGAVTPSTGTLTPGASGGPSGAVTPSTGTLTPGASGGPSGAVAPSTGAGVVTPTPPGVFEPELEDVSYVTSGLAYEEARSTSYIAPVIALGTISAAAAIAFASQISHERHHHHVPRYVFERCPKHRVHKLRHEGANAH